MAISRRHNRFNFQFGIDIKIIQNLAKIRCRIEVSVSNEYHVVNTLPLNGSVEQQ